MVSVPTPPSVPPVIRPPALTVTGPAIVPLPPSVPPSTCTAPLPVPLPLLLFTSSVPALTVVRPV